MCSPSSGAWRVWSRSGPRENRIGSVLHRDVPITGWSTSSKNPRCRELRQVRLAVRLHDLADRHAGVPEELRRSSSAGRSRHHACRCSSIRSCARTRPVGGRPASGSAAHAGSPSASRSAAHCSSVATAIATQQSSRPYSSTPAVWYRFCGAATGPRLPARSSSAPYAECSITCSAATFRAASTMAASTRPPSPVRSRCAEGEQQPEQRVEPGVGIADAVRLERQPVRLAGQPREPGRVLDDEGERGLVAPRPVEPEAGHPHHDEVGPDRAQRLVVETRAGRAPGACSSR